MPLSWNEIKARALAFSREWKGEGSERAEAQSFWNGFFGVFGVDRRRVAIFEKQVALTGADRKSIKQARIDCFWKGLLLVEHKSAGQSLDRAFAQAADYFDGLAERDLPRYILVSDFVRFRLYDLEAGTQIEFRLSELHNHSLRATTPHRVRRSETDRGAQRSGYSAIAAHTPADCSRRYDR